MAKIGTAQIEIKPVLNEEALDAITDQIERAVREAVQRALNAAPDRTRSGDVMVKHWNGDR